MPEFGIPPNELLTEWNQPKRKNCIAVKKAERKELEIWSALTLDMEVHMGSFLESCYMGSFLAFCRKFVFFNIPQIQYKNPSVQIMLFKNMTPSPFLRFYLGK